MISMGCVKFIYYDGEGDVRWVYVGISELARCHVLTRISIMAIIIT